MGKGTVSVLGIGCGDRAGRRWWLGEAAVEKPGVQRRAEMVSIIWNHEMQKRAFLRPLQRQMGGRHQLRAREKGWGLRAFEY